MVNETSPLNPPTSNDSATNKYYFLGKNNTNYQGGTFESVRDDDGEQVVEGIPDGAHVDEFAPRQIKKHVRHPSQNIVASPSARQIRKQGAQNGGIASPPKHTAAGSSSGGGFFSTLFGKGSDHQRAYGEVGTLMKQRKAPVKIEPKVFFANERTFLAWMHLSVVLAGASIAILAFAEESNPLSQMYGVILLPVAIAFIVYSMYQYSRRAAMIRHRHPGPYEDTVGPAVLGIMLMISIIVQFALKLYALSA